MEAGAQRRHYRRRRPLRLGGEIWVIRGMKKKQGQILDAPRIHAIIRRIALQVIEFSHPDKALRFVGIAGQGYVLATKILEEMKAVDPKLQVTLSELRVDRDSPSLEGIFLSVESGDLDHCYVVLIDDVLNTGKTLAYAMAYLLRSRLKKLETVVLVNRSHPRFPVSATYSGISLNTTLDEHICVDLEGSEMKAFLHG